MGAKTSFQEPIELSLKGEAKISLPGMGLIDLCKSRTQPEGFSLLSRLGAEPGSLPSPPPSSFSFLLLLVLLFLIIYPQTSCDAEERVRPGSDLGSAAHKLCDSGQVTALLSVTSLKMGG